MGIEQRLKELRNNKKISQSVIAEYLGVTKQAYSLYELGKREPDFETLLKLGEFFDVSVDYLLKGRDESVPSTSDDDIKFALFGTDGEVTDEMYEDVKRYAQFIKERNKHGTP